jgi:hypothetical protein
MQTECFKFLICIDRKILLFVDLCAVHQKDVKKINNVYAEFLPAKTISTCIPWAKI